MKNGLAIFGMLIGVLSILAGIFKPALMQTMQAVDEQTLRISEIVIGAILVVLAILTLTGTL